VVRNVASTDSVLPPSGAAAHTGRIVVVDDEIELTRTIGSVLRNEFGPERVHDTSDAREALGWLERERPAVLITDVRMPEMSGLELIARTRELWGAVPIVVMTAYPSPEVRSGANGGSFTYLPKPFPLRSLLDAVRELEARPPSSFSGAIAVSTVADLLQLYAVSGATGVLAITAGQRQGWVWFDAGQIVHASVGVKKGFDAVCDMVPWPHGSFSWRPRRAAMRTIEMSTSEVLLEAYRVWDESRHEGGGAPPAAAPSAPPAAEPSGAGPAMNASEVLSGLRSLEGFVGACLADSESEAVLGQLGGEGGGLDFGVAVVGNAAVVRVQRRTMAALRLDDEIEDILITLGGQYHLIRPLRSRPGLFLYLALERRHSNLALARLSLVDAEQRMTF
jgi:CheY-like chemotaxis protein